MAVATPTRTITSLRNCGTDRGQIINRAAAYAIEMLYKELKNNINK
jgi:nicotinamide-nucleotide amidase